MHSGPDVSDRILFVIMTMLVIKCTSRSTIILHPVDSLVNLHLEYILKTQRHNTGEHRDASLDIKKSSTEQNPSIRHA